MALASIKKTTDTSFAVPSRYQIVFEESIG